MLAASTHASKASRELISPGTTPATLRGTLTRALSLAFLLSPLRSGGDVVIAGPRQCSPPQALCGPMIAPVTQAQAEVRQRAGNRPRPGADH